MNFRHREFPTDTRYRSPHGRKKEKESTAALSRCAFITAILGERNETEEEAQEEADVKEEEKEEEDDEEEETEKGRRA